MTFMSSERPSRAADLGAIVRGSTASAPAYDWDGYYIGGHVGYGRGNSQITEAPLGLDTSHFNNSFGSLNGGLQFGYNFMLPSRVLLGIETDVTFPDFLDPTAWSATTASGSTLAQQIDYMGTVRGRIGQAFGNWLIYGTGGFAWMQSRFLETPGLFGNQDKIVRTRAGWTMGAGVEAPIAPHWSFKLEYLYDRFGKADALLPSGMNVGSMSDVQSVRVGLNYKLNGDPRGSITDGTTYFGTWNLHGQTTFVGQGYYAFPSPYQGDNSLSGANQAKNTWSATAFIGYRLWEGGELYVNPELMQGFGLSDVHGVAAFPNGEAQKSSFPAPQFNVARAFVRQTFGFGGEQETVEDAANQLPGKRDISRITVTAGKFAVPDYFDGNVYANDPRTTFLNWNIYGGGAYDWTMDKLSWTYGAFIDFNQKWWAFRTGYFLLPVEANANYFDTNIPERGQYTAELELRYSMWSQPGKLRLFGWFNRGNMGGYADALTMPVTTPGYPDITLTRKVRTNYGAVASFEQAITSDIGIFSRVSWNPGQVEILGWTDCDEAISIGTLLKGTSWGRPDDRIGIAGVVEGLSAISRAYFAAGGLGILIGDGALNYRNESVLEAYYAYSMNKWSTVSLDYQFVENPGYNAARGPVSIYSVRLHAEF